MNGLEFFESGWKGNEAYKSSFLDADLDPGGFNWVLLGNLNTSNNAFLSTVSFTLPAYGKKLIASVTSPIGVALSPLILNGTYINTVGVSHFTTCQFVEGATLGSAKLMPLQSGDIGLTSLITISTSTLASGSIQLASPNLVNEQFFGTDWDPPSPGL